MLINGVEVKIESEANLCEANLYGANLREANLCGANLCGADLYEADLYGASLCEADLCGANLREADLRGADLRGANLRGANLRGAEGYLCLGWDPRGYHFRAIQFDNVWHITAGCRNFTLDEARIHWTNNRDALARLSIIPAS